MKGYGGTGDDKIVFFNNDNVFVVGNDGDDILYGGDGEGADGAMTTIHAIYGDESLSDILANPSLALVGGDDKIYGGNNLNGGMDSFFYSGGPGSDFISIGGGSTAGDILVTGDNLASTDM